MRRNVCRNDVLFQILAVGVLRPFLPVVGCARALTTASIRVVRTTERRHCSPLPVSADS